MGRRGEGQGPLTSGREWLERATLGEPDDPSTLPTQAIGFAYPQCEYKAAASAAKRCHQSCQCCSRPVHGSRCAREVADPNFPRAYQEKVPELNRSTPDSSPAKKISIVAHIDPYTLHSKS